MKPICVVALLLALAGAAFGYSFNPCPPPTSGMAYPVGGGLGVPFHLAYVSVPPTLIWGGVACGQAPSDTSTYSSAVINSACPVTVVHFFEDDQGTCWAQEETIPCEGPTTERWLHVVTP